MKFPRLAILAVLAVLGRPCSAALVDCEFDTIRGTPVANLFLDALKPKHVPGQPKAANAADLSKLARVLVQWDGVKSPPIIRFIGLPARATMAPLIVGETSTQTPLGPSWPLPNLPGFAAVVVGEADLVVSTPAKLAALAPVPVPGPTGHAMQFTGPATDLKLGDLLPSLRAFSMTYDGNGSTKAVLFAKSESDAKHVDRYIWWRKPLVYAGADLGISKLQFPARLLDQTDISRDKDQLVATTSLDGDIRNQAFQVLADTIQRELRNFQPHQ